MTRQNWLSVIERSWFACPGQFLRGIEIAEHFWGEACASIGI
jgi:hypothetical protein